MPSVKSKAKTAKPKKAKPKCGAATRTCQCGHHKREHAGRSGRCWHCGAACEAFAAKPCQSDITSRRSGRCRMHGGTSPAGIISPNWKTGRWAQGIKNKGLRDQFYAALGDPDLARTQQDVAMADAMVSSLLATLPDTGPMSEVQERRLSKLLEQRQQFVERQAKIEQRLGLWIHFTKYQTVMMGMVNVLHEELKLPDGQMDVETLARVQKRVEALMLGMMMDRQAADEGDGEL